MDATRDGLVASAKARIAKVVIAWAARREGTNEMGVVRIEWEGPLSVEHARSRRDARDYGLYQVYGTHVVFGANALLYVGRATEQTFGERLSQHHWIDVESEATVRLGRLVEEDTKNEAHWWDVVCRCEALTIYRHSPPYNSKHIQTCDVKQLHIQNWGASGRLMQEFSSDWRTPPRT